MLDNIKLSDAVGKTIKAVHVDEDVSVLYTDGSVSVLAVQTIGFGSHAFVECHVGKAYFQNSRGVSMGIVTQVQVDQFEATEGQKRREEKLLRERKEYIRLKRKFGDSNVAVEAG